MRPGGFARQQQGNGGQQTSSPMAQLLAFLPVLLLLAFTFFSSQSEPVRQQLACPSADFPASVPSMTLHRSQMTTSAAISNCVMMSLKEPFEACAHSMRSLPGWRQAHIGGHMTIAVIQKLTSKC